MENFANQIYTFCTSARPVVIAVVAAALLISGIMLIYPNERSKQAAKESLPFVIIGSAIALGAVTLAKSLTAGF